MTNHNFWPSRRKRSGTVNYYGFKYYNFLYSVNREESLYNEFGSSINLLQQYLIDFMTVFLHFKAMKSPLKLFMTMKTRAGIKFKSFFRISFFTSGWSYGKNIWYCNLLVSSLIKFPFLTFGFPFACIKHWRAFRDLSLCLENDSFCTVFKIMFLNDFFRS